MNGGCSKCGGEGRVMVREEGNHWHWDACPDCNGFDDMERLASQGDSFDSYGTASPYVLGGVDAALNDDLPY